MNLSDVQNFQKIIRLDLLAKSVVEGFLTGLHRSPFHGFSVEFAEHRQYNHGDPLKHIDWKVYARTNKLFLKKFEEETNLRTHIILDNSSSMYFPEKQNLYNKASFSAISAASLIYLMRKQRDATGLSIFADELEIHTEDKLSNTHQQLLISELQKIIDVKRKRNKKTNAIKILHQIAEQIHKRSVIILFTDLLYSENKDEIFSALQHLKYNKHEVILFHVIDKDYELDFNLPNKPMKIIDAENNETIKLRPTEAKEFIKKKTKVFFKEISDKITQYEIDFKVVDINQNFEDILFSYLTKRNKMF